MAKHRSRRPHHFQASPALQSTAVAAPMSRPVVSTAISEMASAADAPYVRRDLKKIALLSGLLLMVIILLGVWSQSHPFAETLGSALFRLLGVGGQ